jgi:UDP:flavonoid glycosyltransferase YjiC (YdhE family)
MGGAAPQWPGVAGRKILAYVNPEYVDFDRLLTSLKLLGEPVLVHAPGVSDAARRRFSCPSLAFSVLPLDMEEVTATASLVVAHSAIGAGQAALSRGVPVLLLPTHMEQLMAARRVQEFGGGLSVFPKEKKVDYRKVLGRLLDEPSFSAAARAFAERHGAADPRVRADAIAIRCDELIMQASAAAAGGEQRLGSRK